jgi:hypothetical protein
MSYKNLPPAVQLSKHRNNLRWAMIVGFILQSLMGLATYLITKRHPQYKQYAFPQAMLHVGIGVILLLFILFINKKPKIAAYGAFIAFLALWVVALVADLNNFARGIVVVAIMFIWYGSTLVDGKKAQALMDSGVK